MRVRARLSLSRGRASTHPRDLMAAVWESVLSIMMEYKTALGVALLCFLMQRFGPRPTYTIKRNITVAGTLDEVFWFLADFATTAVWDPNVASARKLGGESGSKPRVGDGWELETIFKGKKSQMEYHLVTLNETGRKIGLIGESDSVSAVDAIALTEASPSEVHVSYALRLSLLSWRAPFIYLIGKDLEAMATESLDGLVSTCAARFGGGGKKAAAGAAKASPARMSKSPSKKRK